MSDLISRKELMKELENKNSQYIAEVNIKPEDTIKDIVEKTLKAYRKALKNMISEQPNAYDMAKVVDKLDRASDYYEYEQQIKEDVYMVDLTDAIEIVKGGGIDE